MTTYFAALDGEDEPTIWEDRDSQEPLALVRSCDLPARHRSRLWSALLLGFDCEVRPTADDELFEQAWQVAQETGFPIMPIRLERRLRVGVRRAERLAALVNATMGANS